MKTPFQIDTLNICFADQLFLHLEKLHVSSVALDTPYLEDKRD